MKHWWTGLLATSLLAMVVWGTRFMLDPQRFPVASVHVDGELRYVSTAELEVAVADEVSGNFFRVNLDDVRAAAERLPWVREATARRAWPNRVELHIKERSAAAFWVGGGLVDDQGEVFVPQAGTAPPGLPFFDGPKGSGGQVLARYQEFSALLGRTVRIHRLMVDRRGAWQLELEDGVSVVIGRAQLNQRLARYVRARQQIAHHGGELAIERIDLRYPNGLAVRWAGENLGG